MRFFLFCLSVMVLCGYSAADSLLIIIGDDVYNACHSAVTNYIHHRENAGWNVRLVTRSEADTLAPPHQRPDLYDSVLATNDPADRIKAAIRLIKETESYTHLLLIGNPTPYNFLEPNWDNVGDVPMKMVYPVGDASWADWTIWHVPTDHFYSELMTDWDKNNNGLYAEWNGDRGAGGLSLANPELSVGRIPCYGPGNYADVVRILNKSVWYATNHPRDYASWRYSAFQPNPIDWSKNYGSEGNVSPIFMAESVRTGFFVPHGIDVTRIYEDSYDYSPWNYDPPEIIPQPREYVNFTRYSSWAYFGALFNSLSDNYADYAAGVLTLTDDDYATVDTRTWSPGDWLQFRLVRDDNRQYAPAKIALYAAAQTSFPSRLRIRFSAHGNNWTDAATLVEDVDVWSRAEWDPVSEQYRVVYRAEDGTLTRYGQRRYLRLEYTGDEEQHISLSQFKGYRWEAKSIYPYVTNTWFNRGFGFMVFTTHGSQTHASYIIDSSLTPHLHDDQPALVFLKACQTGWAENPQNLSYALLRNGAIGSVAATRTSWGYSEHGHLMFYAHVVTNMTYGEALRRVGQQLEAVNFYGWDGHYSDVFRFNLYGDPTLSFGAVYPQLDAVYVDGSTIVTSINRHIPLTAIMTENALSVTAIRVAESRGALTNGWQTFSPPYAPYTYALPREYDAWHTLHMQVRNEGGLHSDIHTVSVFLIPEPGIAGVLVLLVLCARGIRRKATSHVFTHT